MAGKNSTVAIPSSVATNVVEAAAPIDYKAEFERLQQENSKLKAANNGPLSLKVSEKGGLSVYGLGRFPVTLYKEQWAKLLGSVPQIKDFIEANASRLKSKGDAAVTAAA